MINITLNGENKSVKSSNLEQLINELSLNIKKIAIEKNQEIIPKSVFSTSNIQENDIIEIIEFVGGG